MKIKIILPLLVILTLGSAQEKSQDIKIITVPIYFDTTGKLKGHFFIDAMINDKGPFKVALDTGATKEVICTKSAKKLGLRTGKKVKVAFGEAVVENISITVSNSYGGANLIGYHYLKEWIVTFDFINNKLHMQKEVKKKDDKKEKDEKHVLDMTFLSPNSSTKKGIFTIEIMVNGKGPYDFIYDTGANFNIVNPKYARKLKIRKRRGNNVDFSLGPFEANDQKVDKMSVGALRGIGKWVGLLGTPFCKEFVTTVNYNTNKITFRKKCHICK